MFFPGRRPGRETPAPLGYVTANCTLGVETVLFFRINEFSNVIFSKFIALNETNKNTKDHI